MVLYRRNKICGGTYFFTITLLNRQSKLLTDYVDLLRTAMKEVQIRHFYKIIAIVILPDHLHAIWQLPLDDNNYSMRWRRIKTLFTRSIISNGIPVTKNHRGEYHLWQRRFWEHTIRDDLDLENHVNYIHYNPVKHQLTKKVRDWPYSSFHSYVKNGLLSLDWGYENDSSGFCRGE